MLKELVRHPEITFQLIGKSVPNAVILLDRSGNIIFINDKAEELFGYSIEELTDRKIEVILSPGYRERNPQYKNVFLPTPQLIDSVKAREVTAQRKSGAEFPAEITLNQIEVTNGIIVLAAITDITERKVQEEKMMKSNRIFAFVSAINQTIMHVRDAQTLYNEACRIGVHIGKYSLAYIGIANSESKKIGIVAQCAAGSEDSEVIGSFAHNEMAAVQNVMESGCQYITNDLDSEPDGVEKQYALAQGFNSAIILPIKKSGDTIGIYCLFSRQKNLFDQQEIDVLDEIAGDLCFALENFEKEALREEVEKKIRHGKLRVGRAQSIAHIGSWEQDLETGMLAWSEETCRIFGLLPGGEAQSQESWLSYIHPDDILTVTEALRNGMKRLSSYSYQYRIIRPDKAVRYLFSEAYFDLSKDGTPESLYGVIHDITESKKAEEALAQSEANLRLIMDLMPQSIFVKDYNGKYIFVNNYFAEFYGVTQNEIVNKSEREIQEVKSDSDFYLKQDQEVISSGKTKTIPEHSYTDRHGNARLFHTVKVPFTIAGTNEKAVLGITTDVTAQKQAEEERTKMIADLVQRNKDLEQFSYIVSHNLRAPVANILGLVNIMQTIGLDKNEENLAADYLTTAAKNLDSVITDINHILELKHKVSKNRELVRFPDLLEEIKVSIENMIKDQAVEIISDFSCVEEMLTIKSYLYSIFFNLISNSIKYRRPGVQPVIDITSSSDQNKLLLVFKDNGLGIDLKKESSVVFGLYKRFHNHVEGKGIGLYMVKTQVETLGGKITIASEVNTGTEFRIEFLIQN